MGDSISCFRVKDAMHTHAVQLRMTLSRVVDGGRTHEDAANK